MARVDTIRHVMTGHGAARVIGEPVYAASMSGRDSSRSCQSSGASEVGGVAFVNELVDCEVLLGGSAEPCREMTYRVVGPL